MKEEVKKKELERLLRKKAKRDHSEEEEEEDEDNFQFYGEEDLYYKGPKKLSKEEKEELDEEIKENRIKLLYYIKTNETVQQALNRLKPKPKVFKQQRIKIGETQQEEFNELLDVISKLTELSFMDVYQDSIDKIVEKYGKDEVIMWKYRTREKKSDEDKDFSEVNEYGPFPARDIKYWLKEVN